MFGADYLLAKAMQEMRLEEALRGRNLAGDLRQVGSARHAGAFEWGRSPLNRLGRLLEQYGLLQPSRPAAAWKR
jgi:hypothetical protein